MSRTTKCVFEHRGHRFVYTLDYNVSLTPPWKMEDGHGYVTEWLNRDPLPGERLLRPASRRYARYYNMALSLARAKADGWGPGTPEEAVEEDFKRMKAWCDGEWSYMVLDVTLMLPHKDAVGGFFETKWTEGLGGIESDDEQGQKELREELADEILAKWGGQQ